MGDDSWAIPGQGAARPAGLLCHFLSKQPGAPKDASAWHSGLSCLKGTTCFGWESDQFFY